MEIGLTATNGSRIHIEQSNTIVSQALFNTAENAAEVICSQPESMNEAAAVSVATEPAAISNDVSTQR